VNIVLITQEAPLYLPELVAATVKRYRQELRLATVLPPYGREGRFGSLARVAALYGPSDFARLASLVVARRAADVWRGFRAIPPRASVRGILAHARIPLLNTGTVNDPRYLGRLRQEAPDVILSLSCHQIFGEALLAIPRLGCFNYHSSLLPRHRGLFSPFWALAEGAPNAGVTVHRMTSTLDLGPFIAQREVPIQPGDSLHALCQRSVSVGAEVVSETLERIRAGHQIPATAPDPSQGSYRGFPTASDGRKFRRAGGRFF
jgi:methionyl-tRNA formyltransferase